MAKPESTVQHWDALWAQFKDEPGHERELRDIIRIAKARGWSLKGKKVLETGAGSGVDSIALARMTDCRPTCVDYSAKAITYLRKTFRKSKVKARLVKADIRKMPFRTGEFDVIFSNGVLEHFRQPLPVVKEQARVLRKGGLLVFGVPETLSLYTIKKQIQIRQGTWFAGWETQYTRGQLRRLMRKAGLEVIEVKVYGNAPLRFPKWLQRTTTALGLNRWLASDVIAYCTKR